MARRKDVFDVIEQIVKDFEKRMEQMKEEMDFDETRQKPIHRTSFSIRISQNEGGVPEVVVQKFDKGRTESKKIKIEPQSQASVRKVKQFVEPHSSTIRKKNSLILEVELPGVKRGDIDLSQLKKSIEVRAYAGNKGYFTIFPLSRGYQVIKDELVDGRYRVYVQV